MKPFVREGLPSAIDIYMTEIGRYPLLSAEQEVKLAAQYEYGRSAERQLESSAPDAQECAELQGVVVRGQRARRQLIRCNLRLVISLAQQYSGYGVPFADLIQEGNIGLIEAVERFDHRHGVRFASYAGWWIRKTVLRALASQGRSIRLPSAVNDQVAHLHKAYARLEIRLGRSPTLNEIATELNLSVQRVRQLQIWDRQLLSLDTPVGENGEAVLADLVPDQLAPTLDEAFARRQLRERLYDVMVTYLNSRDQTLLRLRYGLDGDRRQTLKEVADALGITRERARQVEKAALKRLRRAGALYKLGQV